MSTIKPALIFDFGNVIAFFDYTRACDVLGKTLGLSGIEFLEQLRARGLTPLLEAYEHGRVATLDFSRSFCKLAGLDITHDEFVRHWGNIFSLNEPIARLAVDLKRLGYTVLLGSNTNELHAAHFRRQFAETLSHFDRLVLSHEIGVMKPAGEFYEACASAARRPAEQCIFIDDILENVEGARRAGLLGLHYRDTPTLLAELRQLGVQIDRGKL
jgi:FMN phosphatase YigB (HAD superfamily)